MNTFKLIALLLLLSQPLLASADDKSTREMALDSITRIDLRGSGQMLLTRGDQEALVITATDKMMKNVEIHQKDGTLYLNNRSNGWNWFDWDNSEEVTFAITLKQLERLTLTGAAQVKSTDWTGDRLHIEVTGAGDINVGTLHINKLTMNLTGASHVNIDQLRGEELRAELTGASHLSFKQAGEVDSQQATLAGASHYNAAPLKTRATRVTVAGASNADVYATETLEIEAAGASNVGYYGTTRAKTSVSGISNAKYRGEAPGAD